MSSSYVFTSRSELDDALDDWVSDQDEATDEYGEISAWDVSAITDFSSLFYRQNLSFQDINPDVSNWDVSGGTDFSGMFREASSFNQDLSGWDVSNEQLRLDISVLHLLMGI